CAHRSLRSFPTRRSSDLCGCVAARMSCRGSSPAFRPEEEDCGRSWLSPSFLCVLSVPSCQSASESVYLLRIYINRNVIVSLLTISEEHTYELQSRVELVC